MKKKKISSLAPIPLREAKKKYYRMSADVMEIEGERHLICDFYEKNDKDYDLIMRAAYTAGDWGLWWPKSGWRRCSIRNVYGKPVYDECDMVMGPGLPTKAAWSNTSVDELSQILIKGFTDGMGIKPWLKKEDWVDRLLGIEEEIKSIRNEKEMASRRKKLDERIRDMPPIPDDFCAWADKALFNSQEYVYYKRGKTWADCRCSKCGAEYRIRTERPATYEGQLMRIYPTPSHGAPTNCQNCGVNALYMAKGKMKNTFEEKKKAYLVQPFREKGAVVRYFEMVKEWHLGDVSGVEACEIGRAFMGLQGKLQMDWHLYDSFKGQTSWYDRNIGGMLNIHMLPGAVYLGNADEWKGCKFLGYSGLREYIEMTQKKICPIYYLQTAEHFPLERMAKMGLTELVTYLISKDRADTGVRRLIRRPWEGEAHKMLGIRRCRLALLREHTGDVKLLEVMQMERENADAAVEGDRKGRGEWTEEQIWKVYNLGLGRSEAETALEYMSVTQLLNRVERYAGEEIPAERRETGQLNTPVYRRMAITYTDYIKMRKNAGYGMERTTDIYPRDIREAHNNLVLELNKKETEDRIEKMESKFPNVKKRYRSLKARYGYKADGLFIRPAKSIREIIEEGQILHHCVGRGDTYIRKHDSGESFILFLRRVTAPNDPYITIEVSGEGVRQWYGTKDTQPDAPLIGPFLEKWIEDVKARRERNEAEPAAVDQTEVNDSLRAG